MICCGGAGELDPALSRACVCLFSLSGERERKTGKGEKNNPTTTLDQSCIIGCFFLKKKKQVRWYYHLHHLPPTVELPPNLVVAENEIFLSDHRQQLDLQTVDAVVTVLPLRKYVGDHSRLLFSDEVPASRRRKATFISVNTMEKRFPSNRGRKPKVPGISGGKSARR